MVDVFIARPFNSRSILNIERRAGKPGNAKKTKKSKIKSIARRRRRLRRTSHPLGGRILSKSHYTTIVCVEPGASTSPRVALQTRTGAVAARERLMDRHA